jgi:hypothetical protein
VLAWIFVSGALCFFVYWIFRWSVVNSGETLNAWGQIFALNIAQDILGAGLIKIYIMHVIGIESARPQLRAIYTVMCNLAINNDLTDTARVFEKIDEFRVVQYMVPACRASRAEKVQGLAAAKLLRQLDDLDMEKCRDRRSWYIGTASFLLFAVPVALILFNESLGNQIIDTALGGVVTAFLIANSELFLTFGNIAIAIPYIIICGLVAYTVFLYRPARHRGRQLKAKKEAVRRERLNVLPAKTYADGPWVRSRSASAAGVAEASKQQQPQPLKHGMAAYWERVGVILWNWFSSFIHYTSLKERKALVSQRRARERLWMDMSIASGWARADEIADLIRVVMRRASAINFPNARNAAHLAEGEDDVVKLPSKVLAMRPASWETLWARQKTVSRVEQVINRTVFDMVESAEAGAAEPSSIAQQDDDLSSHLQRNPNPNPRTKYRLIRPGQTFQPDRAFRVFMQSLCTAPAADGSLSVAEVADHLQHVWSYFFPGGVRLSEDEILEIMDMFDVWAISHGLTRDDSVHEASFRQWFVDDLCACISRIVPHHLAPAQAPQLQHQHEHEHEHSAKKTKEEESYIFFGRNPSPRKSDSDIAI